ncbi:pR122-EX5, partial [rat cytomegalovirus strain Maastricht]
GDDFPGGYDIVTAAASISGISPVSPTKKKYQRRLETVVSHLHSRSSHQENSGSSPSNNNIRPTHHSTYQQPIRSDVRPTDSNITNKSQKKYTDSRVRTKPRYGREQTDSSSSEGEDREEARQFYLSSASDDDGEEDVTHLVQGDDHRKSNDTSRFRRKNVYGGSHSSRASSSFRSSGGSMSPKSQKRRGETRSPSPPSSRRRYISPIRSPTQPSGSDSEELPTMVPISRPSYSPAMRGDRDERGGLRPSSAPVKKGKRTQKRSREGPVRSSGNGFLAPNAHRRKPRGDNSEIPVRALEYKNLPFRPMPIQHLMGRAVKLCREGTIHDTFIMMHYTRSQEVRRAVELARDRILKIVNVSMSCPFLTQHTKPRNHSRETVENVSEALASGSRAAWMLDEEHTHDNATRTSDYRSLMLQAATPCDFLCVFKICLELAQEFNKQVCVRLCTIDGGLNPLPIYDDVVSDYANQQFERKTTYSRQHTTPTAYPNRPVDSDLDIWGEPTGWS